MQIKDIAELTSGYTFRESLGSFPKGDTAVIQMKNIDASDRLHLAGVPFVGIADLNARQLARQGDVILRARGLFHTAALVTETLDRAVVAAPLMIIRVTSPDVTPAYLRWFLNLQTTQTTLVSLAAGSYVRTLNKAAIEGLDIPVPTLERQRRIAELAELGVRERTLAMTIAEKRRSMLEEILARHARDHTKAV